VHTAVLEISFHIINIYMHELTLQSEIPSEHYHPPFYADHLKSGIVNSDALSAEHINALSACLTGVDGILTNFLSLEVADIRCLPVFNFARVAYSVVILLKMYFSASNSKNELGQVISKEKMRVDYYLEALLQKFRATAADDKSRVAAKFLVVLAMLRSWFTKQAKTESSGGTSGGNRQGSTTGATPEGSRTGPSPRPSVGSAGHSPSQTQQQQQQHSANTANTPLQLLSEVATGRDSQGGPGRKYFQPGANMRPITQPFFHDSASSASNTPPQQSQSLPPGSTFSPEPGNVAGVGIPGMDADLTAAMAPAFPSWMPPADGLAMGVPGAGAGMSGGFDMSAFGFPSGGGQDAYVDGARMVMNEPWVMDMFQGMSGGPNNFQF
jgi:RalA-binding protein 1